MGLLSGVEGESIIRWGGLNRKVTFEGIAHSVSREKKNP
jgi:hypothetical protein